MNKQDLITKINSSNILDARKAEIIELVNNNELDADMIDQIKSIIQEDIDEDISGILSDDQKKEISDIETEGNNEIKTIATEVTEDVKFVDDQMNDLETIVNSLTPTLEEINIDNIKADLNKVTE